MERRALTTGLARTVSAALLLPLSIPAVSQEVDLAQRLLDNRFQVSAGLFALRRSVAVRVDGSLPGINDDFTFSEQVAASDRDEIFAAFATWRFAKRWRMSAQYFKASDDGSATLDEPIEWEDITFLPGSFVRAGREFSVTRLFVARELTSAGNHNFGIGAGLHGLDASAFIEGQALVENGANEFRSETVSANGPMPNLGAWYDLKLGDRWVLQTRFDWLEASLKPYSGSIINASAGIDYVFGKHFAAGLNYNYFKFNVSVDDSGWQGSIDLTYHGPYISLIGYW